MKKSALAICAFGVLALISETGVASPKHMGSKRESLLIRIPRIPVHFPVSSLNLGQKRNSSFNTKKGMRINLTFRDQKNEVPHCPISNLPNPNEPAHEEEFAFRSFPESLGNETFSTGYSLSSSPIRFRSSHALPIENFRPISLFSSAEEDPHTAHTFYRRDFYDVDGAFEEDFSSAFSFKKRNNPLFSLDDCVEKNGLASLPLRKEENYMNLADDSLKRNVDLEERNVYGFPTPEKGPNKCPVEGLSPDPSPRAQPKKLKRMRRRFRRFLRDADPSSLQPKKSMEEIVEERKTLEETKKYDDFILQSLMKSDEWREAQ